MSEPSTSAPAPRKRGALKILGLTAGVLVLLLIGIYFVATSSAFFKGVILPKASAALNAKITVSDASISPFSQVVLRNLKVETTGPEPLVTSPEVRLRYSLMDILGGNINVEEMSMASPVIALIENPDGTSNLDPILKSQEAKPEESAKPAESGKPMQVNIKKMAVSDGKFRQVKLYQGGQKDVTEVSRLNLLVENVRNGQTGKATVGADVEMANDPPAPEPSASLQGNVTGVLNFSLTPELKPGSAQGNLRLVVSRAQGALAQLAALGVNLECDVTPTEVRQMALRFQRGETRLGELLASGPFNLEKTEGRLSVQVLNIDKNVLNLAGADTGLDFGPTRINSTNLIQLSNSGNTIAAAGQFQLNQFQVTQTNQTTPPLDLNASYDVTVDRAASNVLVRAFSLNGLQKGKQLLRGDLTKPMPISWGSASSAVGDATLTLALTHLDLADWKPFLGEVAPAGDVNLQAELISQQGGKRLTFDLNSQVNNLTAGQGSNQISQAGVTLQMKGTAVQTPDATKTNTAFQVNLPEYKLQVSRQSQQLLTAAGSATYDQATASGEAQLNGQVLLAKLLQAFPQPDMKASSGSAEIKVKVTFKGEQQIVAGNLTLADFTGQIGENRFRSFGAAADLDVGLNSRDVQIRKLSGKLSEAGQPGGAFDVAGTYVLTNESAQLTAKLTDFNQNGLRAFLEPMIQGKQLVSVSINANANVQYDPEGASAVKGDFALANLVVKDPKGQIPATPLEARMHLDASLNKMVADIRQCQLALTPTARATNQVHLTGRVDLSQTNAAGERLTQGNLKLHADSLDVTRYYDLFDSQNKSSAPEAAPKPGPVGPAGAGQPETEPEPMQLPVRNFVAEATVGRLYLREVQIADLQTVLKMDGGHIVLDPCKLMLNGAPVTSRVDLDVGVPGYKYDVAFSAQAIPLAPLVSSFQPAKKGIISGTLTAQTKVTGAGTTGVNLQKNLNGSFDLGSTNLNLSVDSLPNDSVSARLLKVIVNAISVVPELVKNPGGTGASLVTGALGLGGNAAGGTNQTGAAASVKRSPIDTIVARGTMGGGQIALQQSIIRSPAFEAQASGGIALAAVLTNSTIQIPVTVALERSVAQLIPNLVPANTPTNLAFIKLPDYLSLTGTLGDPKSKINKAALAGTLLQSLSGLAGKDAGLVQGLGAALTGGNRSNTNAPSGGTNPPANPIGGLLQGLLGGTAPGNTNAAPRGATNAPATNQNPINNLLNDLLTPKK